MTEHSDAGTVFASKRYTNWPAMTEDLQAGNLHAAFILAPLAMVLAREGTKPVKIVHLGHRDGTCMVVAKDSPYQTFADLRGKRIAIPHRYSNQRVLIERLKEQNGFNDSDVTLIDFPPPEMPAGLKAGQFEAYIVGEPHAARAEIAGFGRILYYTKDIWPNFISCVLVVTQELIDRQPELVQELVSGITASGEWIDQGPEDQLIAGIYLEGEVVPEDQLQATADGTLPEAITMPRDFGISPRMQAAQLGGLYYGQPTDLLKYVLSKPPDRVKYTDLALNREDFAEIQRYAERLGFFSKRPVTADDPFGFEDYCDVRFERGRARSLPLRPAAGSGAEAPR
ncbi:Bicarbonate-binding protein CmpA precursor [Planctomycetes bacterium Poly30]|uniref:Bicarbonate-binding protein CmpA n=1 Tax=Saltatorellus ferox TaxID=2528018 RepID=A0A518ESZ3_9BACT|nr:Bicarbonate-binding protein CmpA precursor [Planctomycetes bacterium Poly30]